MGYLRHKALLVNGWDFNAVSAAQQEVAALYDQPHEPWDYDVAGLVSPVVRHSVNGGASFLIAPDGSKEGWSGSDLGDDLMAQAKVIVAKHRWVDWCEVLCGGDDGEFAILDSCEHPETRAASADTHPKDGDAQQAPLVSGAMPNASEADARKVSHD